MRKTNAIYIISVVFLSIVCGAYIMTQFYNSNIELISKINNAFYTDDAEYFRTSNKNLNLYDIKTTLSDGTLLYNLLSDEQDIRGVIFKGAVEYPNLIRGRFFSENDFDGHNRVAVVGKEVETREENGETVYDYQGETYKVIGILGYNWKTRLDRTVFLSLNEDIVFSNVQYVVSAKQEEDKFKLLSNETVYGEVTMVPRSNPGILTITNTGKNVTTTTIFFVFVLCFNAFVLIYFLIDRLHDEIVIMKMNGISNKETFKHFFVQMYSLVLASVLIGTVITSLIAYTQDFFSLIAVVKSDMMLLFLFGVVIFYSLKSALKQIKNIKSGGIESC